MTIMALVIAIIAWITAARARTAQRIAQQELTTLKAEVRPLLNPQGIATRDMWPVTATGNRATRVEPAPSPLDQPALPVEPIPAMVQAAPVVREVAALVVDGVAGASGLVDVLLDGSPDHPAHRPARHGYLSEVVDRALNSDELEALIGGRWLNRIGAAALVLAAGFFFKYAVDNNIISPSLRVAIGMVAGVLMLFQAWRSHRRGLEVFAQGLTGAGLAVIYLSVYASSNLYHLLPEVPALGAMGVVTAVAFSLALLYDSLAVALLASAGGYVSVPLLGLTAGTQLGAIGYILLLDAWALRMVFRRDDWIVLEPLGLIATYAIYFGWFARVYTPRTVGMATVALCLVWGVFFALEATRLIARRSRHIQLRHALGTANAMAAGGGLTALLVMQHRTVLGALVVGLAAVYGATVVLARWPLIEGDWVAARFTLTSIVLATIGTAFLTTGLTLTIAWSLDALALVWCGARWSLANTWRSGLAAFALATVNFAVWYQTWFTANTAPLHLLNLRTVTFAVLAATLAAAAMCLRRSEPSAHGGVFSTLHYGWMLTAFLGITAEIIEYFAHSAANTAPTFSPDPSEQGAYTMALAWAVYGLVLVWRGLPVRSLPALRSGGLSVCLGILLGAATAPLCADSEQFSLLPNGRLVTLAVLCAVAGAVVWRLEVHRTAFPWIARAISWYRLAALLLGFELITIETGSAFTGASGAGPDLLHLGQQQAYAIAIACVLYGLPLVFEGLRRRVTQVFSFGLVSVGMGAALSSMCVLTFGVSERFTPVLNYRAGALALLCILTGTVASRLTKDRAAYRWMDSVLPLYRLVPLFLGFELVTIETVNAFAGAVHTSTGPVLAGLTQLRAFSLAIVWMLYGLPLVVAGLRRQTFQVVSFGLASLALGLAMGAGNALAYEPVRSFTPVLNYRCGAVLLLGALAAVLIARLHRDRHLYPWIPTAIDAYRATVLLLGFELVTAEINDYFRHAAGTVASSTRPSEGFVRLVTMAALWMLYSFPLVRYGVRHHSLSVLLLGLGPMTAATGAGAVAAIAFDPGGWYSTTLTLRPFILVVLGAGLMIQMRVAREGTKIFPWLDTVLLAMQAATILLGFELITTQTRDLFDSHTVVAGAAAIHHLRDLEQLALSTLWLVYGVLLLAIGLWRRVRWIRLGALAAMMFTLGKIVLYDLSFLTTAYRSASFGALGVVLLGASYLYSRYRDLLVDVDTPRSLRLS